MKKPPVRSDFSDFPVSALFYPLKNAWDNTQSFVVQAEPGAGKSTVLPLFIHRELMTQPGGTEGPGKIIMLEPRRMAARSLARYMSSLTGTRTGEYVGYRVKGDVCCRNTASIEIVTEGVFVRMIQDDPFLEGVSLVIMDEFHERSLFTDLSFAFLADARRELRPDLRLMIMSATAEGALLKKVLPEALFLESRGRMYPVEIRMDRTPQDMRIAPSRVRHALESALKETKGNILIFLPGEGEIKALLSELETHPPDGNIPVHPLYSRLSPREQDRVLNPGEGRMIVAATSIAETSLTIPGISCVIDSGLERRPLFDPHSGMNRLETARISKASAVQRSGRAGRVTEGLCIRLWTLQDEGYMEDYRPPEIRTSELSSLAMELLVWGARNPGELLWPEEPPKAHYAQAGELLQLLGICGDDGQLTTVGRAMACRGTAPRLARMIHHAASEGRVQTACALAALLTEGDWINSSRGSDIRLRLEYLKDGRDGNNRRVRRILKTWESLLPGGKPRRQELVPEDASSLLCLSYPDRIGRIRTDRVYSLSGGGNCRLRPDDPVQNREFLIVPHLGGGGEIPSAFLTSETDLSRIRQEFGPIIKEEESWLWDEKKHRLSGREQLMLGHLILQERPLALTKDPARQAEALKKSLARKGLGIFDWSKEDHQYRQRLLCASRLKGPRRPGNWPDTDDEALIDSLETWFLPLLVKGRLEGRLKDGLASLLNWEQQSFLDKALPERITVPSGSRIRIDYSDPDAPALEVRLQELFGMTETPLIAGEIPLLIRLLNPAQRPIQVTRDLKSFWESTYHEVRKELRGRYPKHYWPEDPFEAEATRRVRPTRRS